MAEVKVNSISGVSYEVKDLAKTTEFYESIGFGKRKEEEGRVTLYVNWFFVTFVAQGQGSAKPKDKGAGTLLHIKVDDIESFHKAVGKQGMKPDAEPQVAPSGNREFTLRDPDGYQLLFFQKK
jgi:predicted lactoylglutathione lyase